MEHCASTPLARRAERDIDAKASFLLRLRARVATVTTSVVPPPPE